MHDQPPGSQGLGSAYARQTRDAGAGKHNLRKSGTGTNFLQYGLVAGFISMAILSTFSSVSEEIAGLLLSLVSNIQSVTSGL